MDDAVAVLPSTSIDDLPPASLEVRQRRLTSAIIGGIAGLIAVSVMTGAFIWYDSGGPLAIVLPAALWFGGFAALFTWLSLRHTLKAGGTAGWVLRENGTHLLVNLRSHWNTHFDPGTPSVLVLPQRRVVSLSVVHEHGVRTHVGDYGVIFENPFRREFLDIAFDGETAAVVAALAAEGARWGKAALGRSRSNHSAVRLLPTGMLRIAWRDENNRLRPGLDSLRRQLSPRYRFVEAGVSEQSPLRALDRAGQESRLLEMLTRGERMEAVALAKVLYSMSTTEAVHFVDSLRH
jgi:hypothetical protein